MESPPCHVQRVANLMQQILASRAHSDRGTNEIPDLERIKC